MTEQLPPGDGVPDRPRPRGRQTALDMVRSMVVIVAVVGVVLLFAPQPGEVEQPQVQPATALGAAGQAGAVIGATPLLLLPGGSSGGDLLAAAGLEPSAAAAVSAVVGVGEGWRLSYARTETTADVPTWRQGLLSPAERRVDLEQAVDPGEVWLTRSDEGDVGAPEPVDVAGLTWSRQDRGDDRTTYTYVAPPTPGTPALTTAVSATSDSADLRAVVTAVSTALG